MNNVFTSTEGATHVAMSNKKQSFGFTLAEVLITLGIIGVVTTMTMPTLIQNHQKQVYITGLKKGISTIQNALNQMKAEEGVTEFENTELFTTAYCPGLDGNCLNWNGDNEYMVYSDVQRILSKYLKVVKTYKSGEHTANYKYSYSATPQNFNTLNQGSLNLGDIGAVTFYTTDGMIFYISSSGWGCMQINIDVNGDKGPNQYGRDTFRLYFYFNNIRSSHPAGTYEYDNFITHLMQNGWKMDY